MSTKKFYITTAIDYVNGKPHIGHALEKIQADVLARWHRIKGDDVFFLTGTDEHGAKIARAAEAAGKEPQVFTDEMSAVFRDLKHALNLSWDDFIRTSDRERHWPAAQKIWAQLNVAGDLYKKQYHGLYCVGHEAFVTEKDLVDGKCRDHQKEPEVVEEENWFFRLSKYTEEIKKRINGGELQILPESRKNEILSLLEQGLEDVSFSRPRKDMPWGIPVPDDPDHTMYVWCDALTNYLSAIGYGRGEKEFTHWWPVDVHLIGKDILRFHAAIWPGMLLSAGLLLPRSLFVHGHITVEGQKMSKTIGNVIDPFTLVQTYGIDPVRYYLLREIPSGEDGDFSYKKFEDRYNGDLANGLGNLVARVVALGAKAGSFLRLNYDNQFLLVADIVSIRNKYEKHMKDFRLNEALGDVWELIGMMDKWINDEKPWTKEIKELRAFIETAAHGLMEIVFLIDPFLPQTAQKIREQITIEDKEITMKKAAGLFPRLVEKGLR